MKHQHYEPKELYQDIDKLLSVHLSSRNLHSSRVLLKPNLISAGNNGLPCTEPLLLATIARWFIDRGAYVMVGDSPAFGTAESVLGKIGALQMLRSVGAAICEFDRVKQVDLPGGRHAGIAAAALECDLLVNVPRVKAHAQARVTIAVKNLFGCVVGMRKPMWHMRYGEAGGFFELLAELPAVLPETVTLLDGVRAMHVTGPIHGVPFALGMLASSNNPFALDTAVLDILGIEPSRCPLWSAADRMGMAGTRRTDIVFHLDRDIKKVTGFIVPDELMDVRFNPFRFVKNTIRRVVSRRMG